MFSSDLQCSAVVALVSVCFSRFCFIFMVCLFCFIVLAIVPNGSAHVLLKLHRIQFRIHSAGVLYVPLGSIDVLQDAVNALLFCRVLLMLFEGLLLFHECAPANVDHCVEVVECVKVAAGRLSGNQASC